MLWRTFICDKRRRFLSVYSQPRSWTGAGACSARSAGLSEALEDSDPDLLQVVQRNLETILALKLDRELLVATPPRLQGMSNATGVATIDATGVLDDYDLLLRAVGVLGGKHPTRAATTDWWPIGGHTDACSASV